MGKVGAFGSNVICLPERSKSRLGFNRRDETQENTNVVTAANDSAEKLYYRMSSLRWQCSVVQVDAGKKYVNSAEIVKMPKGGTVTRDEGKTVTQHEELKICA